MQIGYKMADRKRLKRLQRMVDLQQKIKQMHEWKLAELQYQQTKAEKDSAMLSQALDQPGSSGERLLEMIGQQLKKVNEKEHRIKTVKTQRHNLKKEQHRQLRFVEQLQQTAMGGYQREESKRELSEIIDLALLNKSR